MSDIRELDARAVRASVAIVATMTPGDLAKPTPCAGWTLGDLLAHMITQHNGFAAAARGHGGDVDFWQVGPLGADPAGDYATAADRVLAAFAAAGVLERTFALPEIAPGLEFPAAQAISFHFIDYVVHGWDVARSLGLKYVPDDDLLTAALPVAEAVPDGAMRQRPGAAFAPRLDGLPAAETDPMGRILALLGRSPDWTPSSAMASHRD
jgi:uncharacterized protein (TIGR03086 family)